MGRFDGLSKTISNAISRTIVKPLLLLLSLLGLLGDGIRLLVAFMLQKTVSSRSWYPPPKSNFIISRLTQVILRIPSTRRRTTLVYPRALQLSQQLKIFFLGVFATILFVVVPLAGTVWVRSLPNPQ